MTTDKIMTNTKELEQLKEDFKNVLRDQFNEEKFNEDLKNGVHIGPENRERYHKQEQCDLQKNTPKQGFNFFKNQDLVFKAHLGNGTYIAVGSNGQRIQSKNLDDFNRQIATAFNNCKMKTCTFYTSENPASEKYKQLTESFARNFIKAGIIVQGDLPKDPKFWKELKSDYLKDNQHTLAEWDRLTQAVPGEYKNEKHQPKQQGLSLALRHRLQNMGRI